MGCTLLSQATEVVSVDTEFTEVTTSGPPAPAVTQSPGCHGNQQTASKTVSKNGGGEMRGAESRGARETLASWRATLDQACRGVGGAEVGVVEVGGTGRGREQRLGGDPMPAGPLWSITEGGGHHATTGYTNTQENIQHMFATWHNLPCTRS